MPDAPPPPATPPRHLFAWTLVALGVLVLPVLIFVATRAVFVRVSGNTADTPSLRKMRDIGIALHRYAAEHDGHYPASLADLGRDQTPPADLAPIPGSPFEYLYSGKGLSDHTAANGTVLVYEPPGMNDAHGSHVLYADGTIAFIPAKELAEEIDRGRPPAGPPPE
jgi:hypothetical protein